ncbi:hypothetical protein CTAYLR_001336 [Chrysophaeum taylorii]|uniref:Carrier domain-containing protein n=1 Tax=Chrysophaeum taylorii TaxID=2483200 RepID=A0AAD7U5A5_9STRA|nr:hypothetical protein CTAYLR_001336 [Chrysophaeum taylorii]
MLLIGWGRALGGRAVANSELERQLDTTDAWIRQRTGIESRRLLGDEESLLSLAIRSACEACAGTGPVDLVVVATSTPADAFGDAAAVARALRGKGLATAECGSLDVRSACCGFVDAVAVAAGLGATRACVVGCDALGSRLTDWTDRSTAVLFGDGAAAAVFERASGVDTVAVVRGFPEASPDALAAPLEKGGLSYAPTRMRGAEVFEFATRAAPPAIAEALNKAGWDSADKYVLHQANKRILDAISRSLGVFDDDDDGGGGGGGGVKVPSCVGSTGNCGAASVPTALVEARPRPGERLVLAAFGAGPRVSVVTTVVGTPRKTPIFLPVAAAAAADLTEKAVLFALREVLGESNSFDALDSLAALEFVGALARDHGIDIPPTVVLEATAVADIVKAAASCSSKEKHEIPNEFEATPLQKSMLARPSLFLATFEWRLVMKTSASKLQTAWELVVQRHESLRSSFHGGTTQRVWDEVSARVGATDSGARQQRKEVLAALERGEPCLARLGVIGDRLVATFHHLVIDGLSLRTVLDDLFVFLGDEKPSNPAPRWRDYAFSAAAARQKVPSSSSFSTTTLTLTTNSSSSSLRGPRFDAVAPVRASRRSAEMAPQPPAIAHAAFLAAMDSAGFDDLDSYAATFAVRENNVVGPALATVALARKRDLDGIARAIRGGGAAAAAAAAARATVRGTTRCSVLFDYQPGPKTWVSLAGFVEDGKIIHDAAGFALSVRCVRHGDRYDLSAVSESTDVDEDTLRRVVRALDVCLEALAKGATLELLPFVLSLGGGSSYRDVEVVKQQEVTTTTTTIISVDESTLSSMFALELGEEVDPEANLFSLGVDSLKAMRILSGTGLSLRNLLETPTVRGLAARRGGVLASTHKKAPFELLDDDDNDDDEYPLFGVGAAHFVGLHAATVGSEPIAPQICWEWVPKQHRIDASRLARAFDVLVSRHDTLQCVVTDKATLKIVETRPVLILENASRDYFESGRAIGSVFEWPLFAVGVVENGDKIRVAVSLFLMDAVGDLVFRSELSDLYDDNNNYCESLPRLSLRFGRYARSLVSAAASRRRSSSSGGGEYRVARDYWVSRLKDPDFPRAGPSLFTLETAATTFENRAVDFSIERWEALRDACRKRNATIPSALLTAYAMALARHSAEEPFLLNVLLCERFRVHPDVLKIIGNCSSTVLVEIDLRNANSLKDAVARIAASLAVSLEHAAFDGLQVMALLNRETEATFEKAVAPFVFTTPVGVEGSLLAHDRNNWFFRETRFTERVPHSACVNAVKDDPSGTARASLDFLKGLFPEPLLASIVDAYETVLDHLALRDWDRPVEFRCCGSSVAATPFEKYRLGLPDSTLLHDALFHREEEEDGESVFVVAESSTTMTYREVAARARSLAAYVIEEEDNNNNNNEIVAVVMRKGWRQIVAVHAVLLAGAAYLPIDATSWPADRVSYVMTHAAADLAIVDSAGRALVDKNLIRRVLDGDEYYYQDGRRVVVVPKRIPTPNNKLAYVIYTSGSTGKPKGVACHHKGAVNTISDIVERWGIGPSDAIFGISSLAFDLSVFDIFGAAMAGARLVLPAEMDPKAWVDLANRAGATIWNSVPALFELALSFFGQKKPTSLRLAMLSGDVVPLTLPLKAKRSGIRDVVIMGGATEAAVWSNEFVVPETGVPPSGWTSWPYGRPLYGQSLHILDDRTLEPLPCYVVGPIYIGGVGVAFGYHRNLESSKQQFVENNLFRTGDLGRLREAEEPGDWVVEILGREDSRVKLRGNRVELGEIDAALLDVPGVTAAASVVRDDVLLAFVVGDDGLVRDSLTRRLPTYMLPSRVVRVDSLPLSSNGKVRRDMLPRTPTPTTPPPRVSSLASSSSSSSKPESDVERRIRAAFAKHLGRDCGSETDFFRAGGTSLSGLRLLADLNAEFGNSTFSIRDLLERPTVAALAATERPAENNPFEPLALAASGDVLLVLFNPAGASGLCYLPLAAKLSPDDDDDIASGGDWRVTALDDGVVSGRTTDLPFESIQEAASRAADAVRALPKSKFLVLGGWSYGGVLAYEVARLLRDVVVDGLVLVDAPLEAAVVDSNPPHFDDDFSSAASRHFEQATGLLRAYHEKKNEKNSESIITTKKILDLRPSSTRRRDRLRVIPEATLAYLPETNHWSMLDAQAKAHEAIRKWWASS